MGVHINFVCDDENCKNERGYKVSQPVSFDDTSETWGDMIAHMQNVGWQLDIENSKVVRAICPQHKNKES